MKTKLYLIVLCLTLLTGCVAKQVNLVETGQLTIVNEVDSNSGLHAFAHSEGDSLFIFGYLNKSYFGSHVEGFLQVIITEPSGKIFCDLKYGLHNSHTNRRLPGKDKFNIHLPSIPPKGSVIKLVYHQSGI